MSEILLKMLIFSIQSTHYVCTVLIVLEFLYMFSKDTLIRNFVKFRPVGGSELFHADEQKDKEDMTKLMVAFRSFVTNATTITVWNLQDDHNRLESPGRPQPSGISRTTITVWNLQDDHNRLECP
jgi:hypothetical protein